MHTIDWSNLKNPCLSSRTAAWMLLLATGVSCHTTHGAFRVGGGSVIGDITASTDYTTNTQSNSNAKSDLIFRLAPSLSYETDGAAFQTSVTAGVTVTRYDEDDDNDSENYNISLSSSFPNGMETPYSINLTLSISEQADASTEFGRIVSTRNYTASTEVSYIFSSRYAIQSGIDYGLNQGLSDGLADTHSIALPLSFSYNYSENLSYGLGYRHRRQEVSGKGLSSIDHAIFLQASGHLLPLVDGSLALGTQMRSTKGDSPSDQLAPYASGDLNWKATELTSYSLNLSADFQTSTGNSSSRGYSTKLSANHNFDANLDGTASIGWGNTDYTAQSLGSPSRKRSDTEWTIGTGLSSTIAQHIALSLKLNYTINQSSTNRADFDKLTLSLQANSPF